MRVVVTGNRGYIGTHLVEILKAEGHFVTGVDLDLFEGCAFEPFTEPDQQLWQDLRTLTARQLEGYDCVMHLGAISNDPMGDLDANITYSINRDGSIKLAALARDAGVPRFLFASSCSIYGKGEKLDLTEQDAVNPVSAYAESKIDAEKGIGELADRNFTVGFLRNATAYGYSPMLRIDLVVNNLLGCAVSRGDIRIMSDGTPWRPLVHCRDIARAFVAFSKAPADKIQNTPINVGGNAENYQVRQVGDYVQRLVPNASIVYTGEIGSDPRNYRVSFDLLGKQLPDFVLAYTLEEGMEELHRKMVEHKFSLQDFNGDRYVRLRTLKHRMDRLIMDLLIPDTVGR
ncbi:MAG: SDR family oxidoreductase [Candidatus Sulfotelmatobacter sp.]|jgi:nucleoside-diphosphate-sugar epimerase